MELSTNLQIASDLTIHAKYAKYIKELKRRETWGEIVDRSVAMHCRKFPSRRTAIRAAFDLVRDKLILPSMRGLQFAGPAIDLAPNRMFNCAYRPADSVTVFREAMFLLLGGTGLGYSVQHRHVCQLPPISRPTGRRRFLVGDSIEGWADAVHALVSSYFRPGQRAVEFDYRDIREKGAPLITSGGKAPGPEPLRKCLEAVRGVLDAALDDALIDLYPLPPSVSARLRPVQAHDMLCHIAEAVRAGGIRRAALISLFDRHDTEMLTCKSGPWWEDNPQRGRANNSVVLPRGEVSAEEFAELWVAVKASRCGEPGFYWTNDPAWGCNPCCLPGEAQMLTPNGYVSIEALADGQEHAFVNAAGEEVVGTAWATGFKPVLRISAGNTKSPTVIRSTADHRFMTADGRTVEAKDLRGERLMPFFTMKDVAPCLAVKYGFVFGDGSFRRDSTAFKNAAVSFTPGKDDEVLAMFSRTGWSSDLCSFTVDVSFAELRAFGIDTTKRTYERQLPELSDTDEIADFLTGLFSANGCVVRGARVAYKTTSPAVVERLTHWLRLLGVSNAYVTTNKARRIAWANGEYVSRESYDINISGFEDIVRFAERVSFVQSYKRAALQELIRAKAPFVFRIEDDGEEQVFDFNLQDDTHWGVVSGVVAHNCEIALEPYQFCNLVEVNVSDVTSQAELESRVASAAFIATLQAAYTDFHYLGERWKETTERAALIGVSMTGICSGPVLGLDMEAAAKVVVEVNARTAAQIGINPAERCTTIKPAGTTSMVMGCSSGAHEWHAQHYLRRMRLGRNEAVAQYLMQHHADLLEDDQADPNQVIVVLPMSAPEGAILRGGPALEMLERIARLNREWVRPGHNAGANTNNVSCTVSIREHEWVDVGNWMYHNRDTYNGISVLPYDGGTYVQAPFEETTAEVVAELMAHLHSVDLSRVVELEDATDLTGEVACAGGACEII